MTVAAHVLADLEVKIANGAEITTADAARVLACSDLVSVGVLGELARQRVSGQTITFARVATVSDGSSVMLGDAGELRLTGPVASIDDARRRVRAATPLAAGRVV